MTTTRDLYLARHGQADPHTGALTEQGRRQADLLGQRLSHLAPTTLRHGPAQRTTQTAHLVSAHLDHLKPHPLAEAGDYAPHLPQHFELPAENAEKILEFIDHVPPRERSPELGRRALERFTGPASGERPPREVLITHAYLISFLIAHALDAPLWRWVSTPVANAALTIIRYRPDAPAAVLVLNEMSHLPPELHWTEFPPAAKP